MADLFVTAVGADFNGSVSGRSYVVFGRPTDTRVQLSNVAAGAGGFAIDGELANDGSGFSGSGAGDVNGDGLADLIIGANGADFTGFFAGRIYVVFGKTTGGLVQLSDVAAGAGGFAIDGESNEDFAGRSLSGAGDVNGDGLADLIVGSVGRNSVVGISGRSYVVFGKTTGTLVQLTDFTAGGGGFTIDGENTGDGSGSAVSGAGDVNGDGRADLIVGAPGADPNGTSSGRSYVVFGKASSTLVRLSDIAAGVGGFAINGERFTDRAGASVSGTGDINDDGLADLIIGASRADPSGSFSGRSYVVFGKASTTLVELSDVTAGIGGFAMNGETEGDRSGFSVSFAGDVNGNGLDDLIVGGPRASLNEDDSGRSYVVFSPITPPLVAPSDIPRSAVYNAFSRAGDGPGGNPVVPTVVGDSRLMIDWPDDDFGSGMFNFQTSKERVVLYRSNSPVRNLEPMGNIARVCWGVLADRPGAGPAELTFKYLNHEIADIALDSEADLAIFAAEDFVGPWIKLPTIIDAARNTARVTSDLSVFKHFALAEAATASVAPVNAAEHFKFYE